MEPEAFKSRAHLLVFVVAVAAAAALSSVGVADGPLGGFGVFHVVFSIGLGLTLAVRLAGLFVDWRRTRNEGWYRRARDWRAAGPGTLAPDVTAPGEPRRPERP